MMNKLISGVVFASLISAGVAIFLDNKSKEAKAAGLSQQKTNVAVSKQRKPAKNQPAVGRVARLKMDNRGHFITTAKMNGRKVEVMVDTGATSVAIDEKTARRLGIHIKPSDYIHRVSTANGVIRAASANIDKIQIGRVTVYDVRAAVLEGKGLGGTLLGMSFLGQLREFKVSNGELIMRQ